MRRASPASEIRVGLMCANTPRYPRFCCTPVLQKFTHESFHFPCPPPPPLVGGLDLLIEPPVAARQAEVTRGCLKRAARTDELNGHPPGSDGQMVAALKRCNGGRVLVSLHPAALASVPHGIVLVRVRVRSS